MGKGGFSKRTIYSASRVLITPNDEGHNTFNASEIFGRGIAQAISVTYYPPQSRTAGSVARKYGFAIGRTALTDVFREFRPDIAVHVPPSPSLAPPAACLSNRRRRYGGDIIPAL